MRPSINMAILPLASLPSPTEYQDIDRKKFEALVEQQYCPFVIRNLAKDWPIVKAGGNALNFLEEQALLSNSLDLPLKLTRLPPEAKRRMFYRDDMKAMNFGTAQMSLADCFKRIKRSADNADYAIQSAPLETYFSELLPQHRTSLLDEKVRPLIWFGHGLQISPHFDEADNLAIVAAGKRRFTLFPPEQISNLYIGPLDHTPAGQAVSLVDINNPDLARFPKYEKAYQEAMSVELAPGDAIFIPTPWWHHVEALSDFNVLINHWWSDRRVSTASPTIALLHAIQSFNSMEDNRKLAWMAYLHHYLGDREVMRGHIPEHAQGVLSDLDLNKTKLLDAYIKQELK